MRTGERGEVAAINRGEQAWHKMKQTLNTHGTGSHWEEWRGGSVLSGMRGKATAVSRAGRENPETVAKR